MTKLTIITAADQPYWRCLHQFLLSAERHGLARRHAFVVYDLGLNADSAQRLKSRFSWAGFRRFDFDSYPPHVARIGESRAWKPLIIGDFVDTDGFILWLDSATIFKTSDLKAPLDAVHENGVYVLKGQAQLGARCDPATLAALSVPAEWLHKPECAAGVIGLDPTRPTIRKLIAEWREHALIEAHIWPRTPRLSYHRPEQSLLSILLYKYEASDGLVLPDENIDVSTFSHVRWMSSRNKVAPWVPRSADVLCRGYYAAAKALDHLYWRYRKFRDTRIHGLNCWLHEHFTVYVSHGGKIARIGARPGSYYADPFIWLKDGQPWLFIEEFDYSRCQGRICCMPLDERLSAGAITPILARDSHMSFPLPIELDGQLYLLPETCADKCVDLYCCEEFPHRWRLARRLLYGVDAADSVVLKHAGYWWLITSLRDAEHSGRYLAIFFTDDLLKGAWQPHPVNGERRYHDRPFSSGRNAGAILELDGKLFRIAQDNRRYYGENIKLMRIETLTPSEFRESIVEDNHRWSHITNNRAAHHLSQQNDWLAWDERDQTNVLGRLRLIEKSMIGPEAN